MNSFMNEIETIFQKSASDDTWFCKDTIKLPNRAMSFGDGLFETLVWDGQNLRFFDKHLDRLLAGMSILGLDVSQINPEELTFLLRRTFSGKKKRIRWTVSRAGLGKYSPESEAADQILQITDFHKAPSIKYKADISTKVQLFPTRWSSFKSLNSLPYVLANKERKERGLDEIIILDYRGYISEAGASNIFWVKDGVFYTPSLSCSCINGVSRSVILEYLAQNNLPHVEGEFKITELKAADSVFMSNCTGISYLERCGNSMFSTLSIYSFKEMFD
jgi:branched-subunit amino acid aminotransferase/4-amino-4-deoxychorismate lyase